MDKWARAQIANEKSLQDAYKERAGEERSRMLGAAALNDSKRAREHAQNAQANDRYNKDSQNRERGHRSN